MSQGLVLEPRAFRHEEALLPTVTPVPQGQTITVAESSRGQPGGLPRLRGALTLELFELDQSSYESEEASLNLDLDLYELEEGN
ncbi:MAG: hypothetical protein QW057_05375 [Candidatus Bathyarchaeia archaeon]